MIGCYSFPFNANLNRICFTYRCRVDKFKSCLTRYSLAGLHHSVGFFYDGGVVTYKYFHPVIDDVDFFVFAVIFFRDRQISERDFDDVLVNKS